MSCLSLTDIKPLENLNGSNMTDFSSMFFCCSSFSNIKPLENWNVSNCTNFMNIFSYYSSSLFKKLLEK